MSDGNYNRNLLPYHDYRSGLKAGQAQMRTRALDAFKLWLKEAYPQSTAEEQALALQQFKARLS